MAEATTSEAAPTLWQKLWYTRLSDALRFRFNASLDWRRVLALAELPDELKQVVYDTVRATRLWNREKVDVTRELIDHFLDGLDRGRPAPILAATFGDPKQSATLIRRAKKRGRPLVWQIWHYGWMTTVAGMVAYLFLGLWMMMGRAHVAVDYLAIVNRDAVKVPENERAWPLYRAALLELGPKSSPGAFYPDVTIPDSTARPGSKEWPHTEKLLRVHADAISKLRAAAGRHGLGFVPSTSFAAFTAEDLQLFDVKLTEEQSAAFKSQTVEDRWLISTLLPHLQQLRSAAFVLAADARRAATEGDGPTALADVTSLFGVSRHTVETPFLVNLLVSVAIQQAACEAIADIMADEPQLWTDAELRDLAHTMAAAKIDWQRCLEGESSGFRDVMQRLYTDDGHGDGRLAYSTSNGQNVFQTLDSFIGTGIDSSNSPYANDALAMLMLPTANFVVASRKEMTATHDVFLHAAAVKISTPFWKQDELVPLDDSLLSERAGTLEKYRYAFVRLMVPAFDSLRNRIEEIEGMRDGVFIGIALELYHREHKAWPKSLSELSPRWLPAVPVDRITGKPLGYKIVADRPIVYSVGVDRDDDSGRTPGGDQPNASSAKNFQLEASSLAEQEGDWLIWGGPTEKGA